MGVTGRQGPRSDSSPVPAAAGTAAYQRSHAPWFHHTILRSLREAHTVSCTYSWLPAVHPAVLPHLQAPLPHFARKAALSAIRGGAAELLRPCSFPGNRTFVFILPGSGRDFNGNLRARRCAVLNCCYLWVENLIITVKIDLIITRLIEISSHLLFMDNDSQ